MSTEGRLSPPDRAKLALPFDVLRELERVLDGAKQRILQRSYVKAAERKRGPDTYRVTDDDVLRSSCEVLRETLSSLESRLTQHAKRTLRVRDAS